MKRFYLAALIAAIVCLPVFGLTHPLEEDNNFMVAVLAMQFITLVYVLFIKLDNEKKD
nr:MAG TPA: hypothetical protein [Crassvirales sp.]